MAREGTSDNRRWTRTANMNGQEAGGLTTTDKRKQPEPNRNATNTEIDKHWVQAKGREA